MLSAAEDAYQWEYWPEDERRAPCGHVGLVNLGATCYMATALQHLFMIPRCHVALLNADSSHALKHHGELLQLQKLFAFLLVSFLKSCKSASLNPVLPTLPFIQIILKNYKFFNLKRRFFEWIMSVVAGEQTESVQSAGVVRIISHGWNDAEHIRAEGYDRILHRLHHKARGNDTRTCTRFLS